MAILKMKIVPLESVGTVALRSPRESVESHWGQPSSECSDEDWPWALCYYDGPKVAIAVYHSDVLVGVVLVPTHETEIWDSRIMGYNRRELEKLATQAGFKASFQPGGPFKEMRDRIHVLGLNLEFVMEDGVCTEIEVDAAGWKELMC